MKRRALLRRSVSVLLAGAVAGRLPIRANPLSAPADRKFTVDLVCGNIGAAPPLLEAVELAIGHGFESVAPSAGQLASLPAPDRERLFARMGQGKLIWGAAPLEVDFRGEEAKFQEGLRQLPADAATLQKAGVTRVGTWLSPSHPRLTYLANFRRHTERLRAIARVLGDHSLRFGLEYVGPKTSWTGARHPFVHSMAEARELVDAIDRPEVGLVLDSWHWYCAGESVDDILALRNQDVVACDLNDAPAGIPVDRQMDLVRELPAATGVIDVAAFLQALVKIGYDGPVRAEPFSAALRKLPLGEAVGRTSKAMIAALSKANLRLPARATNG